MVKARGSIHYEGKGFQYEVCKSDLGKYSLDVLRIPEDSELFQDVEVVSVKKEMRHVLDHVEGEDPETYSLRMEDFDSYVKVMGVPYGFPGGQFSFVPVDVEVKAMVKERVEIPRSELLVKKVDLLGDLNAINAREWAMNVVSKLK